MATNSNQTASMEQRAECREYTQHTHLTKGDALDDVELTSQHAIQQSLMEPTCAGRDQESTGQKRPRPEAEEGDDSATKCARKGPAHEYHQWQYQLGQGERAYWKNF